MTHPLSPISPLAAPDEADAGPVALTRKRKRDRPANVPRSPKTTAQAKARGAGKAKGSEPPPSVSDETKPKGEDEEEAADRDSEPAGVDDEIAGAEPAIEDEEEDIFAETKEEDGEAAAQSGPLSKPMSTGSMERLDPMAAYLREVQRHPLLTPEQTHELAPSSSRRRILPAQRSSSPRTSAWW